MNTKFKPLFLIMILLFVFNVNDANTAGRPRQQAALTPAQENIQRLLYQACRERNLAAARDAIENQGALINYVKIGQIALYEAIKSLQSAPSVELVRYLLDHGANPNLRTAIGFNMLDWAVYYSDEHPELSSVYTPIIQMLRDAEATEVLTVDQNTGETISQAQALARAMEGTRQNAIVQLDARRQIMIEEQRRATEQQTQRRTRTIPNTIFNGPQRQGQLVQLGDRRMPMTRPVPQTTLGRLIAGLQAARTLPSDNNNLYESARTMEENQRIVTARNRALQAQQQLRTTDSAFNRALEETFNHQPQISAAARLQYHRNLMRQPIDSAAVQRGFCGLAVRVPFNARLGALLDPNEECSICSDAFLSNAEEIKTANGEIIEPARIDDGRVIQLECKHVFHASCFNKLVFNGTSVCPLCRANFKARASTVVLTPKLKRSIENLFPSPELKKEIEDLFQNK